MIFRKTLKVTEDNYTYLQNWLHIEALKMCVPKEEVKFNFAQ